MSSTDIKPNPNPVPTPYQPQSKGGNPYLKPGTTGPALGTNAYPTQSTSGGIQFSTGQTYPTSNVNTSYTPPKQQTQLPTNTGPAQTNYSTQQSFNPYTTYRTINGETKKVADWVSQGVLNLDGSTRGGGGGGSSTYTSPEGQTFGSMDEYNKLINEAFGSTMGYLNQNENLLGTAKTAAEQAAEADLIANQAQLGTQRENTLGQLATQGRGVQTQKEDALAQARRLYNELQRGNIQRFGGATSAGQAASEIQGAEAQRQFGQTGRQANEAFQKIEQAKTDVESQYQTGILQLKQSQQQALAKIQSDFTNSIMQINNLRAQTEQQKGQAKLQALQNLRSQAAAIQAQATQYEQQLSLMREQANLNIQQYAKTTGAASTTGSSALNSFNTQAQQTPSYSQVQRTVGQNLGNQYIGSIKKPEEWQYQGAIQKSVVGRLPDGRTLYSDGTAGWTQY